MPRREARAAAVDQRHFRRPELEGRELLPHALGDLAEQRRVVGAVLLQAVGEESGARLDARQALHQMRDAFLAAGQHALAAQVDRVEGLAIRGL